MLAASNQMPFAQFPFGRRLPHAGAGRIPITIVTGFLGAGKTSLIKQLLASPEGEGTALVVNEFGEIGIDDALLREGSERVKLLGAGCVCCAAQSELHQTLRELYSERETGRIPPFARVIIETSGLADPSPALQALAIDRTLAEHYFLRALVVVVDACTAIRSSREHAEWAKQAVLADRFVITKTDLADRDQIEAVRHLLAEMNPSAACETADEGAGSPLLQDTPQGPVSGFLADLPAIVPAHDLSYHSFTLEYEAPLAWEAFAGAMDLLKTLRGEELLRVKGFVRVLGRDGPIVVHHVQHLAHRPEELRQWPDDRCATRLVFITSGDLGRDRVKPLFDAAIDLKAERT